MAWKGERMRVFCRSPCGERGLKLQAAAGSVRSRASLPVRGAWIEIISGSKSGGENASLPVRGAWIEILWEV